MARKKPSLKAKDLYRFQQITKAQISPDGQWVIFALQRVDRQTQQRYQNLWLVSTRRGTPRQFTYGDQVDRDPQWSPDSRQIAFLSNRQDKKQSQLHLIPVDGGEARPLTKAQGQFGSFEWSPDGKQLVYAFRKTDKAVLARERDPQQATLGVVERHITRLSYKADGYGFLPEERWHVWVVQSKSGRSKQLTKSAIHDEINPHWSPDGGKILFQSNRTDDPDRFWDQIDFFIISATGRHLYKLNAPTGNKSKPTFSPDGWWIAFYQHGGKDNLWENTHLCVVATDGNSPAVNLTESLDIHVGQATVNDMAPSPDVPPLWSPDSRTLYFQVTHQGNTLLKAISVDGKTVETVLDDGVVQEFHLDGAGEQLLHRLSTPLSAGHLWVQNLQTGRSRQLTRFNQSFLRTRTLSDIEEVWFKGPDNNDLQGWIIKPPNFDERQTYPSILEIHGGPMRQYGNTLMHEFHYLAGQGYVVYCCNPRGGRGYGQAHTQAISNNWGDRDYADLMAWVDWVSKKPYIDQTRMGVTGGSYGGFMTTWIIGHTDRFKAAVVQRAVSNMISMMGSSDLKERFQSLFGAPAPFWEDFEGYWRQSPLKYIGQVKTPTLVIHSDTDLRCDIEQGEQIFGALKQRGIETELVRFPSESHGLSRDGRTDRRIARLKHIVRWFDHYLK
ncbi:MAG: S9 family peptidase [Chloroflexota bacterium]